MKDVATGYGLVEGPVWDEANGLYFSDVHNGGVYLLDRKGAVSAHSDRIGENRGRGLHIVRQILRRHGGAIKEDGTHGAFCARLPAIEARQRRRIAKEQPPWKPRES